MLNEVKKNTILGSPQENCDKILALNLRILDCLLAIPWLVPDLP